MYFTASIFRCLQASVRSNCRQFHLRNKLKTVQKCLHRDVHLRELQQLSLKRHFSCQSVLNGKQSYQLESKPFGKIVFRSEGSVSTQISSIDPQKYPLQNKVIIDVENHDGDVDPSQVELVHSDENIVVLTVRALKKNVSCVAELPLKFDIEANVADEGQISVASFENEDISVQVQEGQCRLKSIQTGNVDVKTQGGDVICEGVLQGNSSIQAKGSGSITVHRIQGLTFKAVTDAGQVKAKALYADRSDLMTLTGDIHIGSCHRRCHIQAERTGNIRVDSLDGNVDAATKEGDIAINYIAQHENIKLHTMKGNIDLKLSDSSHTLANLRGSKVTVADDFIVENAELNSSPEKDTMTGVLIGNQGTLGSDNADLLGNTERHLAATTENGHINVSVTDWFSSLKITQGLD